MSHHHWHGGGLIAPGRIVVHQIGRVAYKEMGLGAGQQTLHVRGAGGVAAEKTMPPQTPQITRPRHRHGGWFRRRRVLIGSGTRATIQPRFGQQRVKRRLVEAEQRQVEAILSFKTIFHLFSALHRMGLGPAMPEGHPPSRSRLA